MSEANFFTAKRIQRFTGSADVLVRSERSELLHGALHLTIEIAMLSLEHEDVFGVGVLKEDLDDE